MLNRYSLKFYDKKLEHQYQESLNSFLYPIVIGFHLTTFLAGIIQTILSIQSENNTQLYFQIIITAYSIFSFPIVYCRRSLSQFDLLNINHLLTILQIGLLVDLSKNSCFLFGSVITSAFSIIIFICDFHYSAIQIVTILLIKLIIGYLGDGGLELSLYLINAFLAITLLMCVYKINMTRRLRYLLTLEKDQWGQILPRLVKNPFILFHYNKEQLRFELDCVGQTPMQIQNNSELVNFLRKSIHKQVNLERYFFTLTNKSDKEQLPTEIDIDYEKQRFTIFHTHQNLTSHLYLLQFKLPDPIIEELKQSTHNYQMNLDKRLQSFIKLIFNQIEVSIKNKDTSILYRMRYIFINFIIAKQINNQKNHYQLKTLKVIKLLEGIKKIIKTKKIENYIADTKATIITSKIHILSLLFFEIQKFRSQLIQIKANLSDEQELNLQIQGNNQIQANKLPKFYYRLIKSRIVSKNTVQLIFHHEPILEFTHLS